MASTTLKLCELALSTAAGNGGAIVAGKVRSVSSRLAMASPETAVRCPHVRSALDSVTLATVLSLVSDRPATPPAEPAPDPADSVLGTAEAARVLGVSGQA